MKQKITYHRDGRISVDGDQLPAYWRRGRDWYFAIYSTVQGEGILSGKTPIRHYLQNDVIRLWKRFKGIET